MARQLFGFTQDDQALALALMAALLDHKVPFIVETFPPDHRHGEPLMGWTVSYNEGLVDGRFS